MATPQIKNMRNVDWVSTTRIKPILYYSGRAGMSAAWTHEPLAVHFMLSSSSHITVRTRECASPVLRIRPKNIIYFKGFSESISNRPLRGSCPRTAGEARPALPGLPPALQACWSRARAISLRLGEGWGRGRRRGGARRESDMCEIE